MPNGTIKEQVIKDEFYKSTEKFHVAATWVGLILNVAWFISDYFILFSYYKPFLVFRLLVSLSSAFILIYRKTLGVDIYFCMFFLVLGISIQNSYMWSVMDISHLQKHTFAYIVLFIGAGMLVLWELKYSLILAGLTVISNIVFYVMNSPLGLNEFMINGGLITLSVVIFTIFLIRTRYRLTYNEIRIRLELEASKIEIQNQKDSLEEKNREITDSINYAKNIQHALIPSEIKFNSFFSDSFVLFKPKDIVSGDFYWVYSKDDDVFYVTADCTGHGVPGGFMTMLGLSFLKEIIVGQNIDSPEIILNLMRDKIIASLNQGDSISENKDGMDITVCKLNKRNKILYYSAANNDLYIVRQHNETGEKTIEKHRANRQPCGQYIVKSPFTLNEVQLNEGDCIYTCTDGYADQFGGEKGKKFRYKNFENVIIENSHLPFGEQKQILDNTIIKWRGALEQVDDILVIGIKV